MAAKPLIGINTDYRASRKEHAALSFVAAGYFDGITAAFTGREGQGKGGKGDGCEAHQLCPSIQVGIQPSCISRR